MHRSRSNRKANQERRAAAARFQKPLPLEMQAEIAATRKAEREAEWASQGYNSPVYDNEPRRKPSLAKLRGDPGILGGLIGFILREYANEERGLRGSR